MFNICFKLYSVFIYMSFGLSESLNQSGGETSDYKLVPLRGFNLISGIHNPEAVDKIQNFEIRDSDVFVITYPKSGKIKNQQPHVTAKSAMVYGTQKEHLYLFCFWLR